MDVTVITPVYVNVPERWRYFVDTIESFQRCALSPTPLRHLVLDDRSPLMGSEIAAFCEERGLEFIGRVDEDVRRGFYDVLRALLDAVNTEFVVYLEGDHFFYLPYDFFSPIVKLYRIVPDLHQVYLRAPISYDPFILTEDFLVTYDRSRLFRVRIDEENTGWVGTGQNHESYSMMPTIARTETLRRYVHEGFIPGAPWQIELVLAKRWEHRKLVAYLNGQAFCYHIGGAGKVGTGGFLEKGDARYEGIWSRKVL